MFTWHMQINQQCRGYSDYAILDEDTKRIIDHGKRRKYVGLLLGLDRRTGEFTSWTIHATKIADFPVPPVVGAKISLENLGSAIIGGVEITQKGYIVDLEVENVNNLGAILGENPWDLLDDAWHQQVLELDGILTLNGWKLTCHRTSSLRAAS